MNVTLGENWTGFIENLVAGGDYQDKSDVIRDALRSLKSERAERAARLQALKRAVNVGLGQLDAGEGFEMSPAEMLANIHRRAAHRPNAD